MRCSCCWHTHCMSCSTAPHSRWCSGEGLQALVLVYTAVLHPLRQNQPAACKLQPPYTAAQVWAVPQSRYSEEEGGHIVNDVVPRPMSITQPRLYSMPLDSVCLLLPAASQMADALLCVLLLQGRAACQASEPRR
jgi:hypothetical protein